MSEDDLDNNSVNTLKRYLNKRGTTAENKYNNIKVNIPESLNPSIIARENSLGSHSINETASNKRINVPKSIRVAPSQHSKPKNLLNMGSGFNSEPEMGGPDHSYQPEILSE